MNQKAPRFFGVGVLEISQAPEEMRQISPTDVGTNNYLMELGMSSTDRNAAFGYYGKETIRATNEIAHKLTQNGISNVSNLIPYLLQAIDNLGEKTVSELVLAKRIGPDELLTHFKTVDIDGINVIIPSKANVSLESITSNNITPALAEKGLLPVYQGPNAMVFDYK